MLLVLIAISVFFFYQAEGTLVHIIRAYSALYSTPGQPSIYVRKIFKKTINNVLFLSNNGPFQNFV